MSVAHRNSRMRKHPTLNHLSPMPGGRSLFQYYRLRRSRRAPSWRQRRADRGSAFVLAVILLGIFAALAAGFAAETGMNLQKADNLKRVDSARLGAESGMQIAERIPDYLMAPITRIAATNTPAPFSPVLEKLYVPQPERIRDTVKELVEEY